MFDTVFLAPAEYNRTWSVPTHLIGEGGRNRASIERAQIAAVNDLEAISVWLAEFAATPATFRSYRKEAERLVLWATHQHGCAISDLTREDRRRRRQSGAGDALHEPVRAGGHFVGP